MFNNTLLANKDIDIHLVEKVRAEEKSIIALENMLGYNISKLEELRPHQKDLEFFARTGYEEIPDLINLGYWMERIDNTKEGIEKREENIIQLYDRLYSQIILKMIEGEKLDPLENFFFQGKVYMEKVKCGQMSFGELVEKYDWKKEQFKEE
ncbi:unnamed protein product [marine sediment metagenome]|uniref:Uncharacterized protein n=1 Tax=marine sediment metagenome TaxID=412755 RepID=X1LRG0_9ZZZZ